MILKLYFVITDLEYGRWMDGGQDDKVIERVLEVLPPQPPPGNLLSFTN